MDFSKYGKRVPLNTTSLDKDNKVYMTKCQYLVWNFDKVSEKYLAANYNREELGSADALLDLEDSSFFLIEFKNGNLDEKRIRRDIKVKLLASLFILLDSGEVDDYEYCRRKGHFILVYNESKNRGKIASCNTNSAVCTQCSDDDAAADAFYGGFVDHYEEVAEHVPVILDLKRDYEGCLFKSVRTFTEKQFEKYFVKVVLKNA